MATTVSEDLKDWYALSCPTTSLRFDKRTLELLDTNSDGHILTDEVLAAIRYLKEKEGSSDEGDERLRLYRANLDEFLANYVTMDRLNQGTKPAIFQAGVLRIDGKELHLCFHVDNEEAHAALVGRSNCCVIYVKLVRPGVEGERTVCAVVTAGTVGGLYVGRNGVFYDYDGSNWEAVITRVVESQVSLAEAFWAPWRKLFGVVVGAVKKFIGDRKAKSESLLANGVPPAKEGGAAMASAVAAVGIGVGMIGAAAASVLAAIRGMGPWQLVGSMVAVVLIVSLPSVLVTWFKLRRRDLGAILNASGWAVNREIRFSMARANEFTRCAKVSSWWLYALVLAIVAVLGVSAACHFRPDLLNGICNRASEQVSEQGGK